MVLNLEHIHYRLSAQPGRRLKRCLRSTHLPFKENNARAARSGKKVGGDSQYYRRKRLVSCMIELHAIGFEIEDARHLQHKHIKALIAYWLACDFSASTIQNRMTSIRTFLSWVGKTGMIGPATDYVSEADRHRVMVKTVAETPKGWAEHGVDVAARLDKLVQKSPRSAMVILICESLGVRRKEACTLRPHDALAELESGSVLITHGTKGGRDRDVVSFDLEGQKEVLKLASLLVDGPGASLIPKGMSAKQFLTKFRNDCRRAGFTRDEHCNPHAFRHSHAIALYEKLSGYLAPVKGQGLYTPVDGDEAARRAAQIDAARLAVSRNLGHNRAKVTGAYIGGLKRSRSKKPQPPLLQHHNSNPEDTGDGGRTI